MNFLIDFPDILKQLAEIFNRFWDVCRDVSGNIQIVVVVADLCESSNMRIPVDIAPELDSGHNFVDLLACKNVLFSVFFKFSRSVYKKNIVLASVFPKNHNKYRNTGIEKHLVRKSYDRVDQISLQQCFSN